jgi:hypothetical protein
MRPHGRTYWLIVAAAAVAGIVLLSAVGSALLRHGRDGDAHERALRDSLAVARGQTRSALTVAAARESVYIHANAALDSLLRQPPKTIYVRRSCLEAPAPLLGDTERPQTPSGEDSVALVPLPVYSALESRCRDLQGTCDSLRVATDSVKAAQGRQIGALSGLVAEKDRQIRREHVAQTLGTVRDVGLGVGLGAALHWIFGGR